MVVNSLTEVVVTATNPVDQNVDNIQIINAVIFEVASLLGQTSIKGYPALRVIQVVSRTELPVSSFQLYLF